MAAEISATDGVRDQVILVTGSSRGIGRQIAHALAAAGATVVVTGRDHAAAWKVANSLPGGAIGLAADLSDPRGAEGLIAEAVDKAGRLDGLVSNAGVSLIHPSAET